MMPILWRAGGPRDGPIWTLLRRRVSRDFAGPCDATLSGFTDPVTVITADFRGKFTRLTRDGGPGPSGSLMKPGH